jgi:hypothetical protein
MSTVGTPTLTVDEPRKVNWSFEYIKTFLIVVLVIFVAIDVFYQNRTDERMQVKSFSYHAYQNNSGAMHSPFLGKIRLMSSDIHVAPEADLLDKMQQSACENKTHMPIDMQKCKMMRTPTVYLGKIHSSWSVLGAQSVFTLVKHIGFILIAFVLFSWVEEQIRLEGSTFRIQFRFVRSITVVLAIVFLTVNIILDITNDMHQLNTDHENQISIGSITTGFSFCLVSIVIICFSHLDDPQHEEKSQKVEEPKSIEAPVTQLGLQGIQFYFGTTVAEETKNDANKRLHDIYGMLHTSHLLLVIFPLVLILALVKTKNVIVDVHLQLIFFSSIFFALLDIIQTRVVSVLASFKSGDSIGTPIGNIKFFVSLAFFLAKLFVYVPTLQIILVYYTKLYESEWWLVFCVSLLFLFLSLLDVIYMSGMVAWKESEAWIVSIRKVFFVAYAVSLVACIW